MKKIKYLLLVIVLTFISVTGVKAETLYCDYNNIYPELFERFGKEFIINELNALLDTYKNDYEVSYPFYSIQAGIVDNGIHYLVFQLLVFTENPVTSWYYDDYVNSTQRHIYYPHQNLNKYKIENKIYSINDDDSLNLSTDNYTLSTPRYLTFWSKDNSYYDCTLNVPFYTSLTPHFIMPSYDNLTQINLQNEPGSNSYEVFTESSDTYLFKPYSIFLGIDLNNNYTEVNLNDYEYVLLNLKDYTKKESFNTTMQVKGSIGITPIYEYGTTEKTTITDICNISYSDYTDYRFSILKNDIINNSIYAVKGCKSGSSFKFNNNIFNITYVTADNVNDPVVTIGGQKYHTIPFNQLSNTVNKNTEEGFIPGESEGFHPIESIVNYVTSFWSSLSSFMSLVTKFFNTLPPEIKAVSITCFTTACTLGLLKILKS